MSDPRPWTRRVLWLPSTHTYLLSRRNTASRIIMYSISLRVLSSLLVSPRTYPTAPRAKNRPEKEAQSRQTYGASKQTVGGEERGREEGRRRSTGPSRCTRIQRGPYTPTTISVTRWRGGQMLGHCNSGVALAPEQKKEEEKKTRRTYVGLGEKGILVFLSGSETLVR